MRFIWIVLLLLAVGGCTQTSSSSGKLGYGCSNPDSSGCSQSLYVGSGSKDTEVSGRASTLSATSGCAENGSCYGDISSTTGAPKTVPVKGYYRKDGTYVRGHYRSKGRR